MVAKFNTKRKKPKPKPEPEPEDTLQDEISTDRSDGCKNICRDIWKALQMFTIISVIISSLVVASLEYYNNSENLRILVKCPKEAFYDRKSKKCITCDSKNIFLSEYSRCVIVPDSMIIQSSSMSGLVCSEPTQEIFFIPVKNRLECKKSDGSDFDFSLLAASMALVTCVVGFFLTMLLLILREIARHVVERKEERSEDSAIKMNYFE